MICSLCKLIGGLIDGFLLQALCRYRKRFASDRVASRKEPSNTTPFIGAGTVLFTQAASFGMQRAYPPPQSFFTWKLHQYLTLAADRKEQGKP